jgi:hypothetical protein
MICWALARRGKKMQREKRYLVIKLSDAAKYLTPIQIKSLREVGEQIDYLRALEGKPPMQCVVVEHDWPEYEPTWKAIEQRVDAVPNG